MKKARTRVLVKDDGTHRMEAGPLTMNDLPFAQKEAWRLSNGAPPPGLEDASKETWFAEVEAAFRDAIELEESDAKQPQRPPAKPGEKPTKGGVAVGLWQGPSETEGALKGDPVGMILARRREDGPRTAMIVIFASRIDEEWGGKRFIEVARQQAADAGANLVLRVPAVRYDPL